MPRGRRRVTAPAVGISAEVLTWALDGLQREIAQTKDRLAELTARASEVRQALDQRRASAATVAPAAAVAPVNGRRRRGPGRRRKRNLSPEGRERIKEALRRRWERYHEEQSRQAAKKKPRRRKAAR